MDVSGLHVKKAIVFQAPSLSDLGLGEPALLVADGDDLAIISLQDFSRDVEAVEVEISCTKSRAT